MIKTVIFDMGGVVITLDENEAGKRFVELGMKEFAEKMDPYKQSGLNGDLEEGKLSEEEYRRQVSEKVGREVRAAPLRSAPWSNPRGAFFVTIREPLYNRSSAVVACAAGVTG